MELRVSIHGLLGILLIKIIRENYAKRATVMYLIKVLA